jgi:serine carboxypeptidase-like clade 2
MNEKGRLEFLWSHGFISDEGWAGILANCTFTPSDDWQCTVAALKPRKGNFDRYNVYAPLCFQEPLTGKFYSSSYVRA